MKRFLRMATRLIMKQFGIVTVLIVLIMTLACSSGKDHNSNETYNFSTFKVKRPAISHFSECGEIKKGIKLETSDKSVFGSIGRLLIDKKTGDILIGDFDSKKMVLRFNQEGRFLTTYGKIGNGPQEYQRLIDFGIADNGDIILLASPKLIKFSSSGTFLLEKKLDIGAHNIEIIKEKIYLSVFHYRNKRREKKAIQMYDLFLTNIGGIGQYEERFEKYVFSGSRTIASSQNLLYFTDSYDLGLNTYDLTTQKISHLRIPNNNSVLDSVWEKKHFIEADMTEIKKRLNFFSIIFPMENNLILSENHREKKVFDLWRLNLEKKEAIIYSNFCFYKKKEGKEKKQLFFSQIAGTDKNTVIAVFFDPEDFNKYKNDYPALKDIEFKFDDNPILAFYEFNEK